MEVAEEMGCQSVRLVSTGSHASHSVFPRISDVDAVAKEQKGDRSFVLNVVQFQKEVAGKVLASHPSAKIWLRTAGTAGSSLHILTAKL